MWNSVLQRKRRCVVARMDARRTTRCCCGNDYQAPRIVRFLLWNRALHFVGFFWTWDLVYNTLPTYSGWQCCYLQNMMPPLMPSYLQLGTRQELGRCNQQRHPHPPFCAGGFRDSSVWVGGIKNAVCEEFFMPIEIPCELVWVTRSICLLLV